MKNRIYSYLKKISGLLEQCSNSTKQIFKASLQPYRLKRLYHFMNKLNKLITTDDDEYPHPTSDQIPQLRRMTAGLHQLLPHSPLFTYSILIPVYKPKASYFKIALESALQQTAPQLEVLVGFDGPQPADVYEVVETLKKQYPSLLKSFQLDRATEGGSISASTNSIARHAVGNFLVLMDHDDWIRPDMLYRYEQTLRRSTNPQNTVLYCDEYKIDENDFPIPKSGVHKPLRPNFPFVFNNWICHCLLVPKPLWLRTGGLRVECNGAQDYDLVLRLELAGAEFYNVPFYLYAWRSHEQSTAQNAQQKSYVIDSGIRAVTDYCSAKKLNWKISSGYFPTTYRAIPASSSRAYVHAIIPFRDQKKLTLNAIKHLLAQKNVNVKITAVDNNSSDHTIAKELGALGVEVIPVHESFNYSRLNNIALKKSQIGRPDDLLLFLHNDVDLEPDALEEMCRWIHQPGIGMVGCRLNFPNGLLQHGGIEIFEHIPVATDKGLPFNELAQARILRTVDAVSTACAVITRDNFVKLGGFDEIWHPIVNSNVNLAARLKARGLSCFYTPHAVGIHHETSSHKHLTDYKWF